MKLIQKLPIGLGLACALMLGSCSQEDVQTPQPQAGGANEHSGAKTNAGVEGVPAGNEAILPIFPNTINPTVNHEEYPRDWAKVPGPLSNFAPIPAGTSNRIGLWGHLGWDVLQTLKWVKPLPAVPGNPTANSMITVVSHTYKPTEISKKSSAFTTLGNLKPGKTYAITFFVATTINTEQVGSKSVYAKSAEIKILSADAPTTYVSLFQKEAEWVKKTITFKATKDKATFVFSGLTQVGGGHSYIHLFVDTNSIKELTAVPQMVVQ